MTPILAIETSTEACSVALRMTEGDIFRYAQESRSHTKLVMPMIEGVLSEASLRVSDLEALTVSIGPGSFTGLRIGFAAIQGLAYGLEIPVLPISTLEVMCATYHRLSTKQDGGQRILSNVRVMPVIDARMNELNCGCYEVGPNKEIITDYSDRLLKHTDAIAWIKSLSPDIIVTDKQNLFDSDITKLISVEHIFPHALDLLDLAQRDFNLGMAKSIDLVELSYLRGAEAWQKRKRIRE